MESLSYPLPQRAAAALPDRPAAREEGLRLIPARSIGSVPMPDPAEATARSK